MDLKEMGLKLRPSKGRHLMSRFLKNRKFILPESPLVDAETLMKKYIKSSRISHGHDNALKPDNDKSRRFNVATQISDGSLSFSENEHSKNVFSFNKRKNIDPLEDPPINGQSFSALKSPSKNMRDFSKRSKLVSTIVVHGTDSENTFSEDKRTSKKIITKDSSELPVVQILKDVSDNIRRDDNIHESRTIFYPNSNENLIHGHGDSHIMDEHFDESFSSKKKVNSIEGESETHNSTIETGRPIVSEHYEDKSNIFGNVRSNPNYAMNSQKNIIRIGLTGHRQIEPEKNEITSRSGNMASSPISMSKSQKTTIRIGLTGRPEIEPEKNKRTSNVDNVAISARNPFAAFPKTQKVKAILDQFFPVNKKNVTIKEDTMSGTDLVQNCQSIYYGIPKLLPLSKNNHLKRFNMICKHISDWNAVRKLNEEIDKENEKATH